MKLSKILCVASAAAVAATVAVIPSSAEGTTYHAYLGIQSASYTFRNAWNEPTYGQGTQSDDGIVYFDTLTGWDGATAVDKGGDFTDAEITGDGTYTVSLSGDFDFGSDETLNLLFVSTDIPLDSGATITDVKVSFDDNVKYTFDEAYLSPDETTYLQPMAVNIWNDDLGKEDGLFGYTMPSSSVSIEFTVSGLGDAAAADDTAEATEETDTEAEAATDEAPASDNTTDSATTGNASAAAVAAVMMTAAAAVVLSRKK